MTKRWNRYSKTECRSSNIQPQWRISTLSQSMTRIERGAIRTRVRGIKLTWTSSLTDLIALQTRISIWPNSRWKQTMWADSHELTISCLHLIEMTISLFHETIPWGEMMKHQLSSEVVDKAPLLITHMPQTPVFIEPISSTWDPPWWTERKRNRK